MFHLFNKVYVTPDWRYDLQKKRYVISKNVGSKVSKYLEDLYRVVQGNLIFNSKSWETAVGKFGHYKTDLAFFDDVFRNSFSGDIKIYVDNQTMDIIYIKWLKILFANINVDFAYKLYNLTQLHLKYRVPGSGFIWEGLDSNSVTDSNKNVLEQWQILDKQQFTTAFNKVKLDLPSKSYNSFRSKVKSYISVEWLIANYLYDGSFFEELSDKVYSILVNTVNDELRCFKDRYITNIMHPHIKQVVGYDWDVDQDIVPLIENNRALQFIFSNELDITNHNFLQSFSDVDFRSLVSKMLDYDKQTPFVSQYTEVLDLVLDSDRSNTKMSRSQLDKLLQRDKQLFLSLFENGDKTKVNILIIHWIYLSDEHTLSKFKIQ